MPAQPYNEILNRVRSELSPEEQLRLAGELSRLAALKGDQQRHSILDLEGLGKDVWNRVDPDTYIAEQRDSWDG